MTQRIHEGDEKRKRRRLHGCVGVLMFILKCVGSASLVLQSVGCKTYGSCRAPFSFRPRLSHASPTYPALDPIPIPDLDRLPLSCSPSLRHSFIQHRSVLRAPQPPSSKHIHTQPLPAFSLIQQRCIATTPNERMALLSL